MGATVSGKSARHIWIGRAVAVGVLVAAAVVAFWFGVRLKSGTGSGQELVVADRYLDLGLVWEDRQFPWTLPVENRTDHDIEIEAITSSCKCAPALAHPVVIPAGKTVDVQVRLDLAARLPGTTDAAGNNYEIRIIPKVKGWLPRQEGWTIRGRVEKALTIAPTALDFGNPLMRGRPFSSRVTSVSCGPPMKDLTAECDPAFATVKVSRVAKSAGKYEIAVTPANALPSGPFDFRVTLRGRIVDGKTVSGVVGVVGWVREELAFVPDRVMFGAGRLGQTVQETVTLQLPPGTRMKVIGFGNLSGGTAVERVPGGDPQCQVFRVSQKVSRVGDQRTIIRCRVEREGIEKQEEVSLSLTYHGIES